MMNRFLSSCLSRRKKNHWKSYRMMNHVREKHCCHRNLAKNSVMVAVSNCLLSVMVPANCFAVVLNKCLNVPVVNRNCYGVPGKSDLTSMVPIGYCSALNMYGYCCQAKN